MSNYGILFLVWILSVSASAFISMRYLLNQLMDLDQTCIDTLLGRREELNNFWWPWPYFHGDSGTLKCPKYGFRALSLELVDGFWPNLHRYIVGRRGRVDKILVTLTLFSRSHQHSEVSKIVLFAILQTSRGILTKSA